MLCMAADMYRQSVTRMCRAMLQDNVSPGRRTHILMGLCLCAGSCGVFLSAIICSAAAGMDQPSAAHQHDACLSLNETAATSAAVRPHVNVRLPKPTKYINSSSWNRTFSADVLAPTYFCNAPTASSILPGCRPANLPLIAASDWSLLLVLGCSTAAVILCWCELQSRQTVRKEISDA